MIAVYIQWVFNLRLLKPMRFLVVGLFFSLMSVAVSAVQIETLMLHDDRTVTVTVDGALSQCGGQNTLSFVYEADTRMALLYTMLVTAQAASLDVYLGHGQGALGLCELYSVTINPVNGQ